MESVVGGSAADAADWDLAALPDNFFDLTAVTSKGEAFEFSTLRGQAVIVVNVASK